MPGLGLSYTQRQTRESTAKRGANADGQLAPLAQEDTHLGHGVVEVRAVDHRHAVGAGEVKALLLQLQDGGCLPFVQDAPAMGVAAGSVHKEVPVGNVQHAEEGDSGRGVRHAGEDVAALEDQGDPLPQRASDARLECRLKDPGLGERALESPMGGRGGPIHESPGVEGVPFQHPCLGFGQDGADGFTQKARARVVGQAQLLDQGVREGGLAHTRGAAKQNDEGGRPGPSFTPPVSQRESPKQSAPAMPIGGGAQGEPRVGGVGVVEEG